MSCPNCIDQINHLKQKIDLLEDKLNDLTQDTYEFIKMFLYYDNDVLDDDKVLINGMRILFKTNINLDRHVLDKILSILVINISNNFYTKNEIEFIIAGLYPYEAYKKICDDILYKVRTNNSV